MAYQKVVRVASDCYRGSFKICLIPQFLVGLHKRFNGAISRNCITTLTKGAAMVTIVAKYYEYIVGVDTHAKQHVYAILNNLGECIGNGECRVLPRDFRRTLLLIRRKVANAKILFAIEGTSSYGETFTHFLLNEGEDVCEVKPPKIKSRGNTGKSDQIDAEMAARSVLYLPVRKLIQVRKGEQRKILRIALGSRSNLVKQQTMDKNALIALIRSVDLGIDGRRALSDRTIYELANSRSSRKDAHHIAIARTTARELAIAIVGRAGQLSRNEQLLKQTVQAVAPNLLELPGIGPVSAAQILCVYSHKGRIPTAEAFCCIAGVAPIPASSGNTMRHRLSRFGDRALNHAINVIATVRMRTEANTIAYMEKRSKLGNSRREIKRLLKRYIARSIFKELERLELGVD